MRTAEEVEGLPRVPGKNPLVEVEGVQGNPLQTVGNEIGTITLFLFACIFIYMLLGGKVLTLFLWVVLLSQVIVNYDKIESKIKGVFR